MGMILIVMKVTAMMPVKNHRFGWGLTCGPSLKDDNKSNDNTPSRTGIWWDLFKSLTTSERGCVWTEIAVESQKVETWKFPF